MIILDPADVSLYEFCTDETLFDFKPKSESWMPWNTIFKVLSGIRLNKAESKFFDRVSGGIEYKRGKMPKNLCAIIGRGGGKSLAVTRIGQYRGLTFNRQDVQQTPSTLIMSPSWRAGKPTLEYMETLFMKHPEIKQYCELYQGGRVAKKTEQEAEIKLKNRMKIHLMPTTRVSGRGVATWTLIMEECAHFKTDGRFSDTEIYKSARPSMNRFGMDSMFCLISSPLHQEGLLWHFYEKYFGVSNDHVLVIQGSSKDFNPTLTDEFIQQELKETNEIVGGDYYQREYLAQFTEASAAAFPADDVNACILSRVPIPYDAQYEYFGLLDPASLTKGQNWKFNDEFTVGVAHIQEVDSIQMVVVDCILAFSAEGDSAASPQQAIDQSIQFFKSYNVSELTADLFSAKMVLMQQQFEAAGFSYNICKDKTETGSRNVTKWDLYQELVPIINTHRIRFADDGLTSAQGRAMERKKKGGVDRIDHPENKKDDRFNIVALAQHVGSKKIQTGVVDFAWV